MTFIWSAFVIGIVGNLHCIGMCGPIALALPLGNKTQTQKKVAVALYNLGRLSTYALFGLILGFLGEGLSFIGISQYLSLVFGLLIVFIGLLAIFRLKNPIANGAFFSSYSLLKRSFSKQLQKRSNAAFFTMGVLNGFLPCGLIYVALAGALASGNLVNSVAFMLLFGMGTLPAMLLMPLFSDKIKPFLQKRWKLAIPILTLCFGLLMVLRGSNLGIPYLSPKASTESVSFNIKCH